MVSEAIKTEIMDSARDIMRTLGVDQHGNCLYAAASVIIAGKARGVPLVLQAGSARWPRVTPDTDNGTEPNVLEFKFSGVYSIRELLIRRHLPEIHCWAGHVPSQEIVDMTTGQFPKHAEQLMGLPWKAPKPPEAFWGTYNDLPDLAAYRPDFEATMFAHQILEVFGLNL